MIQVAGEVVVRGEGSMVHHESSGRGQPTLWRNVVFGLGSDLDLGYWKDLGVGRNEGPVEEDKCS